MGVCMNRNRNRVALAFAVLRWREGAAVHSRSVNAGLPGRRHWRLPNGFMSFMVCHGIDIGYESGSRFFDGFGQHIQERRAVPAGK